MVFLGLALIILGGIAVLSAVFVSEPGIGGELLGFDVTTLESFFVGVARRRGDPVGLLDPQVGHEARPGAPQGAQGADQAQREARAGRGRAPRRQPGHRHHPPLTPTDLGAASARSGSRLGGDAEVAPRAASGPRPTRRRGPRARRPRSRRAPAPLAAAVRAASRAGVGVHRGRGGEGGQVGGRLGASLGGDESADRGQTRPSRTSARLPSPPPGPSPTPVSQRARPARRLVTAPPPARPRRRSPSPPAASPAALRGR